MLVLDEFAVNCIEKGVQVELVLAVETVNSWLLPAADAVIETGGPPHRCVKLPR